MINDLTSGNVLNRIIRFSIPIFLGNLLQQLYNMADSIIVGKFISKEAFAAVGATGSLSFLIIGFVLGLCCGLCVPIAQCFGAGNMSNMRKKIATAIYISIAIGLVLTIITVLGTTQLLIWMKTPDNIFKDSHTYISIIFLGIPATLLYNLPANISRAIGDSKTPLYFLIVSAVLNVILDLLFVYIFSMGVEGTAIATVISQVVSGTLCILYMKKKYSILKFKKEEWVLDLQSMKHSAAIGIPMGLQFSITAIGSVVLQSAVNSLGSDTVAAVNASMKIQMIFIQPLEALGLTIATFCGQNLGAGNLKRIREGVKKALILSAICSIAAFVMVNLLAVPFSHLFLNRADMTPYIIVSIKQLLRYNSYFYFFLGSLLVLRNALQGLGYSFIAMGAGVFEMFARSIFAFLSIAYFGFTAICFANPTAWFAANIMLIPVYIITIHKLEKIYQNERIEQE